MIMAQSCASKRSNTSNPSSASRTRSKLLEQNSQRKREVGRGTEHRLRAYNSGSHAPLRRGSNVHIGRISWRLAVCGFAVTTSKNDCLVSIFEVTVCELNDCASTVSLPHVPHEVMVDIETAPLLPVRRLPHLHSTPKARLWSHTSSSIAPQKLFSSLIVKNELIGVEIKESGGDYTCWLEGRAPGGRRKEGQSRGVWVFLFV